MQLGSAGVFYIGPQSVSPVGSGNASNGVSIDPVSGDVVLGNDVGGTAATLVSVREIPFSGQGIILSDTPALINTLFFPGFIQVNTATSLVIIDQDAFQIYRSAPGTGSAAVILNDGVFQVQFGMDSAGNFVWVSNFIGQFGGFDPATGNWQVGLNPGGVGVFNGAQLEVVGDLTYDLFVNQNSGGLAIDPVNDRAKLFTNNAGASTFDLPAAPHVGFHCMFAVQINALLEVQAAVSDSINIAGLQGVLGGRAITASVGSFLHLVYIGNNQWVAASSLGAWVLS